MAIISEPVEIFEKNFGIVLKQNETDQKDQNHQILKW